MSRFGKKSAIRDYDSPELRSVGRKSCFDSALHLMRSLYQRNSYEQSHRLFRRETLLFSLRDIESEFLAGLLRRGYGVAPGFFSKALIDRIHTKADEVFRKEFRGKMDLGLGMPVSAGAGIRMIEMADPLAIVPEALDIAFHESILKVAAHFFRHIPRIFRVSIVRYIPNRRPVSLSRFGHQSRGGVSLSVIIDLADIGDVGEPLVYIPYVNHIHSRPLATPPECADTETSFEDTSAASESVVGADHLRQTPRDKWILLRAGRGSIVAVPRRGTQGTLWMFPTDTKNTPRTSMVIDIGAHTRGELPLIPQNRMLKWNFDRMTALQQLFAYPGFVDEPLPAFAKVS